MADNVSFETEFGEVTMKRKKNVKQKLNEGKSKAKLWWDRHGDDVRFYSGIAGLCIGAYGIGRLVSVIKSVGAFETSQVVDNDEGFILHAFLDKDDLAKAGLDNNYQLVLKRFGDAITDSSVDVIDI